MRIVLLAPIHNSLYARLLTHLISQAPDLELRLLVVRSIFSLDRFRAELRRDGARLVDKIFRKLVLGESSYPLGSPETLPALARLCYLPDSPLPALGARLGIECLDVRDHNDQVAEDAIRQHSPDVIVFTGGGLIRKNILALPRLGVLNCHAGLLPPYRGMDVVEWPILERRTGVPLTGITLHFMDRGVDTGPVLLTQPLPVQPGDTFESLRSRLEPLQVELMMQGLHGLASGVMEPRPQALTDGRQYFVMHPRLKSIATRRLLSYQVELGAPADTALQSGRGEAHHPPSGTLP